MEERTPEVACLLHMYTLVIKNEIFYPLSLLPTILFRIYLFLFFILYLFILPNYNNTFFQRTSKIIRKKKYINVVQQIRTRGTPTRRFHMVISYCIISYARIFILNLFSRYLNISFSLLTFCTYGIREKKFNIYNTYHYFTIIST